MRTVEERDQYILAGRQELEKLARGRMLAPLSRRFDREDVLGDATLRLIELCEQWRLGMIPARRIRWPRQLLIDAIRRHTGSAASLRTVYDLRWRARARGPGESLALDDVPDAETGRGFLPDLPTARDQRAIDVASRDRLEEPFLGASDPRSTRSGYRWTAWI